MNILLLGSGGREHALAWKLNQSVWTNPLYIAPGNPGTAKCGINVQLDIHDFDAIRKFCITEKIEMIIVGPEELLVNGLYDYFKSTEELQKIYFIGPSGLGRFSGHRRADRGERIEFLAGLDCGVHRRSARRLAVVLDRGKIRPSGGAHLAALTASRADSEGRAFCKKMGRAGDLYRSILRAVARLGAARRRDF